MTALGYAIVEAARPGRFDVDAADGWAFPTPVLAALLQRDELIEHLLEVRARRAR
jgi:hypothetical protein